jgi:hypothetical protein
VAVAAHDGEVAPPSSGDSGGTMQWSSGSKMTLGSFMVMPLSSSRLQFAVSGGELVAHGGS